MFVNGNAVQSVSSYILRSSDYVQPLAQFMKDRPGSANQKIGWVLGTVATWVQDDKKIVAAHGVELEMMPPLNKLDGFVHAMDNKPVFRELPWFRLQDPAMAFKGDGKRTMNRFIQKADEGVHRQLDIRWLSPVFWMACARAIHWHENNT